jgi:hypothetical protein
MQDFQHDRFNRYYELNITNENGTEVKVRPPLHIEFQGQKSIRGQLNNMTINIFNLKKEHYLGLVKDAEDQKKISVTLSIGYNKKADTIFKGNVQKGTNSKSGAEIVTSLECLDGGFDAIGSFTSKTVSGSENSVNAIIDDMPNTEKGKITTQKEVVRPIILLGNSYNLLQEIIDKDQTFWIDNEEVYIMKKNDVTSSFIPTVRAGTGLLGTPERENKIVTFSTTLNPQIRLGRRVNLDSVTAPHLNGIYKVETIGYKGALDGSDWSQSCTCLKSNSYSQI